MPAQILPGSFTKASRLSRQEDYQRVFHGPCRSRDHSLIVMARENGLGYPRLGMAISKNSIRQAVARNRLKRLIRESFRKQQQDLQGLDIVVTTSKNPGKLSGKAITAALEKHWQKLTACRDSSSL